MTTIKIPTGIVTSLIALVITLIIGALVFSEFYPTLVEPERNDPDPPMRINAARHNHIGLWMIVLFGAFRPELYKLFLKVIETELI